MHTLFQYLVWPLVDLVWALVVLFQAPAHLVQDLLNWREWISGDNKFEYDWIRHVHSSTVEG